MKKRASPLFVLAAILIMSACKEKDRTASVPSSSPPPSSPPAATAWLSAASLTANPSTVERGQVATLTWRTTNVTAVSIDGIGVVDPNGSRQVTPQKSTTYHLTAIAASGALEVNTHVTVGPR